jgi:hypothetical protein
MQIRVYVCMQPLYFGDIHTCTHTDTHTFIFQGTKTAWLYIYAYVHACTHTWPYIHKCMIICTNKYSYMALYTHVHGHLYENIPISFVHTCIYAFTSKDNSPIVMCTNTYPHVHVFTHLQRQKPHSYMYKYINIHVCVPIHTYIHVSIHACMHSPPKTKAS